ncbi:MAG TPA: DUF72 domain-containing protein [Planctomycetaceae bacterium]|nr:DUF72 domain-containing protein [Planctomycetaceae bacterium]
MQLFVGTSGYSYKEWKGSFYPKDLAATKMLRYYGEHFPTVEINSTFFALPKVATLEQWASQVPENFHFSFKAPKRITHVQSLKDKAEVVAVLNELLGAMGARRGPVLYQLPPSLKKDLPRLQAFLETLPAQERAAFEFRHETWFDEEVFGLLRDHGAALCVADADDDLKVPFVATADWGYLRLRRLDYNDAALKEWIGQIHAQKWSDAFVYFRHEDEGNGPRMAQRMIELNQAT